MPFEPSHLGDMNRRRDYYTQVLQDHFEEGRHFGNPWAELASGVAQAAGGLTSAAIQGSQAKKQAERAAAQSEQMAKYQLEAAQIQAQMDSVRSQETTKQVKAVLSYLAGGVALVAIAGGAYYYFRGE